MPTKNVVKKHLTLSMRIKIEDGLNKNNSFRQIALYTEKAHNTISYEVKHRRISLEVNRFNNSNTSCPLTSKSPFVCNGCPKKANCRKQKYIYAAKDAQADYETNLRSSREGIDLTCEEFNKLDKLISEDTSKRHSFAMIKMNRPNEIMVTKRTLYNYLSKGYLSINNLDVPRKVRYKKRNKSTPTKRFKKDPKILEGRRYKDFQEYIQTNNITYYVEMDTVIGKIGGECLLTFGFKTIGLLLAYKLENKDSFCTKNKINEIKNILGYEDFKKVFPVILTDNGSEFFCVDAIENNGDIIKDTKLFFCEPGRSDQKGSLEVAHEYIRRYIQQGNPFEPYTQDDITFMFNNINSVSRELYYPKTPFELFVDKFGLDIASKLGLKEIKKTDVVLSNNIFKNKK